MSHRQCKHIECFFILTIGTPACDTESDDAELDSLVEEAELSVEERPVGVAETVVDDREMGSTLEEEPGDVAPAQEKLVSNGEFTWNQGWAEVPLGTTNGRVCFLTHIQGHFEGGGESVHVHAANGSWWLGGASQQQDVGARARCVNSAYSTYYEWTQGELPKYMAPSSGHTCFLTRVSGKFKGGGEYVYAYDSGHGWYLGGASQALAVSARARCVPHGSSEYNWSQGMASVIMADSATKTCFLNRMIGHFQGGGEAITISASGPNWYLGGRSQQLGVGASARCI